MLSFTLSFTVQVRILYATTVFQLNFLAIIEVRKDVLLNFSPALETTVCLLSMKIICS